ncbi:unnamed protein product [Cylindrotheca closterium]|uniref:Uncharacterized protein n=1 Tax=Cylindrotheca closterium TaxID=2856 RepID=A0AAD2CNK9_9STRA|nr:unnamed protein product [Cylindrotheca closterium]
MAINRSEVAHVVQQAAGRMNLSLETEQEILKSLESESINDVWQLHHISLDRWKEMGAPVGFLASLESCIQEAGLTKDGKGKAKGRKSGRVSTISPTRASGNSRSSTRNSSGKSTTRDSGSIDASTRSASSMRSVSSQKSSAVSNDSRQAALKQLKDRLRALSKQGRAKTEIDAHGEKVYEWDQNDSCVLIYFVWPFEFEFGPDTKFKCTISKDTVLLKGKCKDAQRSLRFATGELVNALHSEWCVVSKGNASNGVDQLFAIEVVLIKKKLGVAWDTVLIAKNILGTNHMSPDQIRDELKSYGMDPNPYKSTDALLKALRMARAKGNSHFSALGSNARKAPERSRSADNIELFESPGKCSPGSLSNSKRTRRARSTSVDRPLVEETKVNKFSAGQIVYYTSSDGNHERAKILKIHLDDELVPFYDIRLTESGKDKQTDDAHLSLMTDFSEDGTSSFAGLETNTANAQDGASAEINQKPASKAPKSRFMENQVVYYTNDGQKEKAKILSIHLDDHLVPFYDIRLEDSGKEKQTTDSRLSSLTDDLFKAAAQGRVRSGSVDIELPASPVRKVPGRSRSMGSSGVAESQSPGPLKKGRRAGRRQSITKPSAATVAAPSPNTSSGPSIQALAASKSRFTENQVVYYTNDGQKEKAKILSIHLDDHLVPFYDIRLEESGNEKQTTDNRLSSLTDDLFKAAAQGRSVSPVRKLPGRSRSMGSSGVAESQSPGPLKKGRRAGRRQSLTKTSAAKVAAPSPKTGGGSCSQALTASKSRFTENQVVYYTNNGQKEKAKILSIHLDDHLVPFYDIRLEESGNEKQTTDNRLSSLTDDLFKAAAQGRSVSPVRKLPGRSRSMGSSGVAESQSPGPLKKGRRAGRRQSLTKTSAAQIPAPTAGNIKKDLERYSGMSANNYNYANEDEMREAWNLIQADSKLSVGRLKKELQNLGESTEYIEKNEMIGALCKARLEKKLKKDRK